MSNKWSYLAGIVDGEGTFSIYYNKSCKNYNGRLTIPNTSMNLMKWLISNFGGRFDTFQPENLHGFNRKPLHRWEPRGKKNREALTLGLIPHLVIKQEQAKLFLEFTRLGWNQQVKRDEIMKKMSQLNRGDESVETNTLDPLEGMIESELAGNCKSVPDVNQGSEIVSDLT